jgi:hypothetical protein
MGIVAHSCPSLALDVQLSSEGDGSKTTDAATGSRSGESDRDGRSRDNGVQGDGF